MSEAGDPPRVAVLSRSWGGGETAFVLRSLAGAISRHRPVDVLVAGRPGPARADGACDVLPLGQGRAGGWPVRKKATWPVHPPTITLAEAEDAGGRAIIKRCAPRAAAAVLAGGSPVTGPADAVLTVGPGHREVALAAGVPEARVHDVGLHVPVNRIAADHRHNGLGFTDYLLVLTDRGPGAGRPPGSVPPLAAWLAARFPREHVVVVEDALAAVWQHRSLRGVVTVDTRTDLWRLMAHARTTIDLGPGPHLARECVESLRFGTPIVAPVQITNWGGL